MAKDKVWAVGDVMHLGSDDDGVERNRKYNTHNNTTREFRRIHEGVEGRVFQFGWGRKHDASVINADAKTVHMLCACGARWGFPQPSDDNNLIKENAFPEFDLLKNQKVIPEFLPLVPQLRFKK